MSFEEALAAASRDEGFKATVYAMNTLAGVTKEIRSTKDQARTSLPMRMLGLR
jgi:hypothetical protein